jgi:hypothetical protein
MKVTRRALILTASAVICIALFIGAGSFVRSEDQNKMDPATVRGAEQNKRAQGVVIGYMESRDKVVTIRLGPQGAVYTVKSKGGKVLDAALSDKELKTKYPSIYSQVNYGLAGNDASLRKDVQGMRLVQPPR